MSTCSKLTLLHVLRMLMHLSSGHVTLLPWEFQHPKFSPNRTYDAIRTQVELCPKFLVFIPFTEVSLSFVGQSPRTFAPWLDVSQIL